MDERELSASEERSLRFLRGLVLVLTATMIFGMGTLIVIFLTRYSGGDTAETPAPFALPDSVTLPQGATATALTRGGDWWAVVTSQNEILIFDADTGALRQRVEVD